MLEKLVILDVKLAIAMPVDYDEDDLKTVANCLLIPLQRRESEGESELIDYAFGKHVDSATPLAGYNYDEGFEEAFPL